MPGMDGIEMLQHLNSDESTSEVPVVVVSACASDGGVRSCEQVKAVIAKPFDVGELCDKVCAVASF